ncbi:HEAT repeat domain-containing protein [Actinoplanes flavus]|uniref:HEAT repeat domain-containing protein n=1 Tax=Actinoplanes flavus TaxID=2820290 RepID=A0ABS3UIF5_9ACTN|nr:HEAT repeat domain-containing protein [Actinoplanes flavus]MBO3738570.1 HEAT repeat domain-containing protein [Actinoplanes flavus]
MSLVDGLSAAASSVRLRAVMAAGTSAEPGLLEALVGRCAVEPDFFVRDMLTWALTRLPVEVTVPRLLVELESPVAQARSQALHTLSKIGDRSVYPAVSGALLHDGDDEVARAAWRAAVALVPEGEGERLAGELARELGRGDRERRLSVSRALVGLGSVVEPVLEAAMGSVEVAVREHAAATGVLLRDPEVGFDAAVHEATRIMALG